MKKGFTLIELLAVIVILSVIALITIPMILNVVDESREAAFKDSVYSAFNAVEYYVLEKGLGDVPESGIEAEFLNLKNNSFTSGRFIKNIDGTIIAEFVSDGKYCATGSLTNLNISKGECEINAPSVVIAVNGKEVTITLTDDNGIVAYALTTNSEEPTEWTTIEETTSITETKTAESAGTYYVHVKNKYGKVSTKEYVVEQNAFCAYEPGDIVGTFDYSGSPEEFIVPCDGTYKLEVYGAQGGNASLSGGSASGGKGGYSYGNITLTNNDILNVVVGSKGTDSSSAGGTFAGGYNGGGSGYSSSNRSAGAGGGGATHIALGTTNRGELNNYEDYKEEVLIIAGGGGGAVIRYYTNGSLSNACTGGSGGGSTGGSSSETIGGTYATGGTQTSGYGFGIGGNGSSDSVCNGGGGGGYYGGNSTHSSSPFQELSGGGGSGYIDGVTDGATENGVREGNGYAQITLVSISE